MGNEIFVDNLFFNPEWTGGLRKHKNEKNGFLKPVIFKTRVGPMPGRPKSREIGYSFPKEALGRTEWGNVTVHYVKPPAEIKGQHLESSIMHADILESADTSATEWRQKYEQKKDELIALKKELEMYKEEEAEKEKSENNSNSKRIACSNPECDRSYTRGRWREEGNECPNCFSGGPVR